MVSQQNASYHSCRRLAPSSIKLFYFHQTSHELGTAILLRLLYLSPRGCLNPWQPGTTIPSHRIHGTQLSPFIPGDVVFQRPPSSSSKAFSSSKNVRVSRSFFMRHKQTTASSGPCPSLPQLVHSFIPNLVSSCSSSYTPFPILF